MAASSGTVNQVASNNVGGTQSLPPINDNTAPITVGSQNHVDASVLTSNYAVQTKYVCEHYKKTVSDPELSSLIYDLQKACNWN